MPVIKNSIFNYVSAPAPRYMLRLAVLKKVFSELRFSHHSSFLEIGPGRGDVSHFLIDQEFIANGCVVDFSGEAITLLKKRFLDFPNISVQQGDLSDLNIQGHDLVCAFEVLEHVDKDVDFLLVIASMLNSGGAFVMSVPAYQKKWQQQDEWAGHLRRYEKSEICEKLNMAGLKVEVLIDYGFPLMAMLVPIKELYYKYFQRQPKNMSGRDKTENSGVDRPFFGSVNSKFSLIFYYPFIWLQKFFYSGVRGDGLIVVARKP